MDLPKCLLILFMLSDNTTVSGKQILDVYKTLFYFTYGYLLHDRTNNGVSEYGLKNYTFNFPMSPKALSS